MLDRAFVQMLARIDALERQVEKLTANAVAAGVWTAFTPTLTQNGAVTFTTTEARYQKVGRTAHVCVTLSVTGTGNAGQQVILGSLPSAINISSVRIIGVFAVYDQSANAFYLAWPTPATASSVHGIRDLTPNVLGQGGFTAALASGDQVSFYGTYETTN